MKTDSLYFVEHLTVVSWLFYVRRFLRHAPRGKVYYFEATKPALFLARNAQRLIFRIANMRDDQGNALWWKITFKETRKIRDIIVESPGFQNMVEGFSVEKAMYFERSLNNFNLSAHAAAPQNIVWHLQVVTNIFPEQKAKRVLFAEKRLWANEIQKYANEYGIEIVWVRNFKMNLKDVLRRGPLGIRMLMNLRFYRNPYNWPTLFKVLILNKNPFHERSKGKILVEHYGHLNLDHPELHSDLFFWHNSGIPAKDIILAFHLSGSLTKKAWDECKKHGIEVVVLDERAKTEDTAKAPIFYHPYRINLFSDVVANWRNPQKLNYNLSYNYWTDFFKKRNIKVHISWFKHDAAQPIKAEALKKCGGVSVIYQRSFEEFPTVTTVASDVVFAFSKKCQDIERAKKSVIPYHVTVGYIGDCWFPLIKSQAKNIRDKLRQSGAEHIIAFLDEDSKSDPRWAVIDHNSVQKDYSFLLEKVLSEPWLGVVLKPKLSATLHRRLGKVSGLLKQAERTGRCFVFERGNLHSYYSPAITASCYPPAIAALAADVTVHGYFYAVTAGLEAALTGTPTVSLDRNGLHSSFLYKLGKGRVIFNHWDELWQACKDHWKTPLGMPGFGDWSLLYDELDPFRDGKAAERIGTYLKWLLDGFKLGLSRDRVLALAAQRYTEKWGKDKVTSINYRGS